jgi:hypothetical protein
MACIADTDAGCHLIELARLLAVSRRADGQDPSEMLAGGVRSELDTGLQNRTEASCRMGSERTRLPRSRSWRQDGSGISSKLCRARATLWHG